MEEDVRRVHGVSGEVCWGVGGGQGSCGKRYRGCSGEVCWGVGGGQGSCGKRYRGCGEMCGGGKERCVGSGEAW